MPWRQDEPYRQGRGCLQAHESATTTIALEVDLYPSSYSVDPTNLEHRWILRQLQTTRPDNSDRSNRAHLGCVAVIGNVREPVKVLAMAGATYAVIGVAVAVFLQTFFAWSPEETASIPLLLTAGLLGGIVVNVLWGALLGFVAIGIKKAVRR